MATPPSSIQPDLDLLVIATGRQALERRSSSITGSAQAYARGVAAVFAVFAERTTACLLHASLCCHYKRRPNWIEIAWWPCSPFFLLDFSGLLEWCVRLSLSHTGATSQSQNTGCLRRCATAGSSWAIYNEQCADFAWAIEGGVPKPATVRAAEFFRFLIVLSDTREAEYLLEEQAAWADPDAGRGGAGACFYRQAAEPNYKSVSG